MGSIISCEGRGKLIMAWNLWESSITKRVVHDKVLSITTTIILHINESDASANANATMRLKLASFASNLKNNFNFAFGGNIYNFALQPLYYLLSLNFLGGLRFGTGVNQVWVIQ